MGNFFQSDLYTFNLKKPLSTMFLIYNQLFPSYLKDKTPGIRNSTFHINTRISSNYSLPRCRYGVSTQTIPLTNGPHKVD